jgi:glyoxylase-like metal-dependent hydrolase (beta-lactamase superfamily II)
MQPGRRPDVVEQAYLDIEYEHGITAVDSGLLRPGMAAAYLVDAGSSLVVVDTGINRSVERIFDAVQRLGREAGDISHVIVTHVHLDHAGGAGQLMQRLPRARLLAHPRAARHLADPSRLEASARRVYGDALFDATYGSLYAIDETRIRVMSDGDVLEIGERHFRFMDTPGHARHHFVVWDEASRGWFTGDTFGISYRDTDTANGAMIFPTTTPTQFEPGEMIRSIDRIMAERPEFAYLTHFGRVSDLPRLAEQLKNGVRFLDSLAARHAQSADRGRLIEKEMMDWMIGLAREHGCTLGEERLVEVFINDARLNTQGLEFMLDHPR